MDNKEKSKHHEQDAIEKDLSVIHLKRTSFNWVNENRFSL